LLDDDTLLLLVGFDKSVESLSVEILEDLVVSGFVEVGDFLILGDLDNSWFTLLELSLLVFDCLSGFSGHLGVIYFLSSHLLGLELDLLLLLIGIFSCELQLCLENLFSELLVGAELGNLSVMGFLDLVEVLDKSDFLLAQFILSLELSSSEFVFKSGLVVLLLEISLDNSLFEFLGQEWW